MRRGNCYVTSEAVYHLWARAAGFVPATVRWEGDVHWFLRRRTLAGTGGFEVMDLTRAQFLSTPPYSTARGRGFMTAKPSKRARQLMSRLVWQTLDKGAPNA